MDDVLKSVPNTEQAIPVASDLMKLLREGGFCLTKFASNSPELLVSIPPASRANPKLDLDLDQLPLERALGIYWYLQFVDEQAVIHCSFVMGKTRNAPIKEWTIPCLELQATVLAVWLSNSVLKELDLQADETFFWSDSMTSLQYIKNQTRRFQTFVADCVAAIHESTSPEQWHHVPASMNLADEGSRSVTIEHFPPGCRWWSGPCFLWQPEQ